MKQQALRAFDALYLMCIWVAGTALIVMCLAIPFGIVARYLFGWGAQWPEPIAVLMMVTFTFFGAAAAYRAGAHIAVTMLTERLPRALQAFAGIFTHGIMLLISVFMMVWGFELTRGTWDQSLGALPWLPAGTTYLPLPLGGLLTLLFVAEHIALGSQHERAVVTIDHAID